MLTPMAIQGVGAVGGFGSGGDALAAALAAGAVPPSRQAINGPRGPVELPVYRADPARLRDYLPSPKLRRMDNFSKLALLAACQAWHDTPPAFRPADPRRVGVVLATAYGPAATTFQTLDSVIADGDQCASPTLFASSVHTAATAHVTICLNAAGPALTVSQFEMSASSALLGAAGWLADGRADAVLFGGVDEYCRVLGYCWESFFGPTPATLSAVQPFAFDRQTAVPGEGAAFLLLTRAADGPGRYGNLVALEQGVLTAATVSLPPDAVTLIGADGHRACGALYAKHLPRTAAVAAFAPLYGSLPVGTMFDLVIAAQAVRAGRLPAPPAPGGAWPGALTEAVTLAGRPVCCLKLSGSRELSLLRLAAP